MTKLLTYTYWLSATTFQRYSSCSAKVTDQQT